MIEFTFGVLVIWNIIVAVLYGIDKYCAVRGFWRISEKTLLTAAFLFGGVGAFFGMEIFRHKTKKPLFKALVPLLAAVNVAIIVWLEGGF